MPPASLPPLVLHRIPREAEWHSEDWDDDTTVAHRHFFGKTLAEAEALFRANSILYQEDIMWMPLPCACYYLQAYSRYLLSEPSRGDADGASCYLTLLAWFGPRLQPAPSTLHALLRQTLSRLAVSQAFFNAPADVYGSFPERARQIHLE